MTINSITLSALQNTEASQFNTDMLGIIALNNPTTLRVVKPYNALNTVETELLGLFRADKSSTHTNKLFDMDVERDDAYMAIALQIESYTYHKTPALRAWGILLHNHLQHFGTGIVRFNYQKETATITNILNDWKDKPELAAAITGLKLTDWVTQLHNSNVAFNTLFLARAQHTGETTFTDSLKEKRIEAANAWYKLRDSIMSRYNVAVEEEEDTTVYVQTINSINAIIDKYNTLLANRRKKKPAATTDNTPAS